MTHLWAPWHESHDDWPMIYDNAWIEHVRNVLSIARVPSPIGHSKHVLSTPPQSPKNGINGHGFVVSQSQYSRANLKYSIHLLSDGLEKLFERLVIVRNVQAVENHPHEGLVLQSPAFLIQDELSLLLWWEGERNCHLITHKRGMFFSQTRMKTILVADISK